MDIKCHVGKCIEGHEDCYEVYVTVPGRYHINPKQINQWNEEFLDALDRTDPNR